MTDPLFARPFVNKMGLCAPKETPIREIQLEVCDRYGLTFAQMISPQRNRSIAWPRQEAFYECSRRTSASLPMIGRAFNRDHSSVLFGIRAHKRRLEEAQNAAKI